MHKGLTLTELLVATILMGIVMAGVAAFSVFVKQARDSTGEGTVLAVETATAMHYIVEDANRAVGDNGDRGVVFDTPDKLSICFRNDDNSPSTATYDDDTWACYWYDDSSDALWKCADRDASDIVPPANFSDCNQGSAAIKLVTLDPPPPPVDYFDVVDDANDRLDYIDITLNTIADPARAANTVNNPTYRLFTRVSPPAHGR